MEWNASHGNRAVEQPPTKPAYTGADRQYRGERAAKWNEMPTKRNIGQERMEDASRGPRREDGVAGG